VAANNEQLTAAVAQDGIRRHARWDAALFAEVARGPGQAVWQAVQGGPQAEPVFAAYLRLVQEALGAGYLRRSAEDAKPRWPNFLTFCLVHLIPQTLAQVPEPARLPTLAQIWNLGEGLLREPAWVDRYVTACAGKLDELSQVEDFLIRTLEPALAPTKPACWEGPFALTVLDARSLDDDFLPGDMHLSAPAVVCLHDRRRADVHLAVFLHHDGQSRFLGVAPCLGQYPQQAELPAVKILEHRLHIGAHQVELPFLDSCREHVLAEPGFALVSAVDSQRLWVVESR